MNKLEQFLATSKKVDTNPFENTTDDFKNLFETKLLWACNDCWCSPCECWSNNY